MAQASAAHASAAEKAVERVTDVLMALETEPASTFRLTPLGVRPLGGPPEGVVMVRLGAFKSGLSLAETCLLIDCLRAENPFQGAAMIADLFQVAAAEAERLRGAQALVAGGGRVVALDREARA